MVNPCFEEVKLRSSFESSFDSDFAKVAASGPQRPAPDYEKWRAEGKKLAEKHSGYQWRIGDWIDFGLTHFDPKNFIGDIPGYMRLGKGRDENGETCYRKH